MTQDELNKKLIDACERGDLEKVKEAIQEGAIVNATDEWGDTPLYDAAWNGHLDIVKYLVENGADVKAVDISGWTPLDNAEYMLGWTPLDDAEYRGRKEVVDYLKQTMKEAA